VKAEQVTTQRLAERIPAVAAVAVAIMLEKLAAQVL
jgi:hypothetical protein